MDWGALNYLEDIGPYDGIPFLVFHGTDDTTVPIATSREFASLMPEQVELIECEGAEHIECWNPDPAAYASAAATPAPSLTGNPSRSSVISRAARPRMMSSSLK